MNRKLASILGLSALLGLLVPADARSIVARHSYTPGTTVSVSMFYGDLSPWGRWVDIPPYGWCWEPDVAYAGWRPYSDGEWIYTDLGWTWVSDEPWAWAVYHYGRWFYDPMHGWVWLPGTEWAPAWVVWRTDWDWVGWAPLPPSVGWSAWFQVRSSDYVRVEPRAWCFTRVRDLSAGNLRGRIVPSARNAGILGRTRDATRYGHRGGWTMNQGPDVALVERHGGVKFPRFKVRDADRPTGGRRGGRDAAASFFRPKLEKARPGEAPGVRDRDSRRERQVAYERRDRDVAHERRGRDATYDRRERGATNVRREGGAANQPEMRRRAPERAKVTVRDRGRNERAKKPERKRGSEDRERKKDGGRDER
jgi:hypothetical protein